MVVTVRSVRRPRGGRSDSAEVHRSRGRKGGDSGVGDDGASQVAAELPVATAPFRSGLGFVGGF
jgi:hypothetical protein